MILITRSLLLSLSVFLGVVVSSAQTFQPKFIQFKGDDGHTDTELLETAGLKKGVVLTAAEMGAHSKMLMDTGMFDNITYTYNGETLTFQLVPATALYGLRFENLPMTPDKELDARIHAQVPLYHGKVPLEGSLLDGVRKELEAELAAKGIQATIATAAAADTATGTAKVMSFSITSPAVRVGSVQLEGASPELGAKAQTIATKFAGSSYSADGSASQLEANLTNYYGALGYVQASVHASAQLSATADADGVHVPFHVTVDEGPQYKLGGVQLAPDMVVTQAAFDKQSGMRTGEVVSLEKLRGNWEFIARQYHNQGMMQAKINTVPSYDRANATASYSVTAIPGPVFTMGTLKVYNVSDDLKAALIKAWRIPSGAVFNEGAIRGMTAAHDIDPALQRLFAVTILSYTLHLHEDTHTVDVDLTLQRRP